MASLGASWAVFGASWRSRGHLAYLGEPLGASWGSLGSRLEASWAPLGVSCGTDIFGVLPGVLCGSQSPQWLGSAGFSWGFSFFSVSKGGNAVEFENYGFRLFLFILGVLPGFLCGSQSIQWLGSAGFSWGFSFFRVS